MTQKREKGKKIRKAFVKKMKDEENISLDSTKDNLYKTSSGHRVRIARSTHFLRNGAWNVSLGYGSFEIAVLLCKADEGNFNIGGEKFITICLPKKFFHEHGKIRLMGKTKKMLFTIGQEYTLMVLKTGGGSIPINISEFVENYDPLR